MKHEEYGSVWSQRVWMMFAQRHLAARKKKIQIATSHSQYIQTSARADSSLGSCCIRECECVCALLKTHNSSTTAAASDATGILWP